VPGLGLAIDGESVRYVAGWGEHGALDAVNHFAATIEDLAHRIETAIRPPVVTDARAPPPPRALGGDGAASGHGVSTRRRRADARSEQARERRRQRPRLLPRPIATAVSRVSLESPDAHVSRRARDRTTRQRFEHFGVAVDVRTVAPSDFETCVPTGGATARWRPEVACR
jgi:hypothetical protein